MAIPSTQTIVLPDILISELYNDNFLDILLPINDSHGSSTVDRLLATTTPAAANPLIEALKDSSRRTFTKNGAPSYNSTNSAILDAFNNLSANTPSSDFTAYLSKSWIEDPELTLRLIWTLRSIPDGKGLKEAFYRAFGWLYKNHPRTAISNLHLLVEPVCPPAKKRKSAKAHGCWKDLLDILCLATLDELSISPAPFLHAPRMKFVTHKRRKGKKAGTPESRIEQSKLEGQERKVDAKRARAIKLNHYHQVLLIKLSQPKFRALYIAIARLFSQQLVKDIRTLQKIQSLDPSDKNRIALIKEISLAGKWAPTPGASHDRVTNIATAISHLIHASQVITPTPRALNDASISSHERSVILRSFYQRWVLTELRQISACPEPLMASNRWTDIKYSRVPSICMNNNSGHFFARDPYGFEKYLLKVESGKGSISGAAMLPHELVAQIIALKGKDILASAGGGRRKKGEKKKKNKFSSIPAVVEARKALAETKARVIEAQWNTLIESLRDAGTLDNCIAICDVSGSMGRITDKYDKNNVSPIFASISLSLVLASLTKPPFDAGFITFSSRPQFLQVNLKQSLHEQVTFMSQADWGQSTDFRAVFIDLLLPLAKKNKIKPESMIKRLFVFSDMQFDASRDSQKRRKMKSWDTTYDFIEKAYANAGYEVPQIVFWDLNAKTTGPKTVEVNSDRKGVAMMNGFSPAMLKVFMGDQEEEKEEEEMVLSEWEEVMTDGTTTVATTTTMVEKEDEFNPINVMKKALLRKTFDGLVVVD